MDKALLWTLRSEAALNLFGLFLKLYFLYRFYSDGEESLFIANIVILFGHVSIRSLMDYKYDSLGAPPGMSWRRYWLKLFAINVFQLRHLYDVYKSITLGAVGMSLLSSRIVEYLLCSVPYVWLLVHDSVIRAQYLNVNQYYRL